MLECIAMLDEASQASMGLSDTERLFPGILMLVFGFFAFSMACSMKYIGLFGRKCASFALLMALALTAHSCGLIGLIDGRPPAADANHAELGIVREVANVVQDETVYVGMEACLSKKGRERVSDLSNLIAAAIVSWHRLKWALAVFFGCLLIGCISGIVMPQRLFSFVGLAMALFLSAQVFVFPVSLEVWGICWNLAGFLLFVIVFARLVSMLFNCRIIHL